MDNFIRKMNNELKRDINILNYVFGGVYLNDTEIKYLKAEAEKAWWKLTRDSDNYGYNTITYKMEKL